MDAPTCGTINRREQTEGAVGLPDSVGETADLIQWHLAQDLGIGLGLANAYLKRCVREGLLKVTETPPGNLCTILLQAFAEKSRLSGPYPPLHFDFMRRARSEVGEIFARSVLQGEPRFCGLAGRPRGIALIVAPRERAVIVGTVSDERDASKFWTEPSKTP